jgi:hypothetical protein
MKERRLSDVYFVEWNVELMEAEYRDGYFVKFNRKNYEDTKIFTIHPDEMLTIAIKERIKNKYEVDDDTTKILELKITNIKPL